MEEPVSFITKAEHDEPPVPVVTATAPSGEPGEMRAELEAAIEAIRPALQMDGGDVTLVGVDESTGVVDIELIGACVGCPASTMTLKAGIERILKDRVDGITEVNAVGLEPAFDY
ncbi:MAG: NifU family protein [Acidimicrobiales bacterium]